MKNSNVVFIITIALIVFCTIIIVTSNGTSPVGYFLWGLVGGLLLFYAIFSMIRENRRHKSVDILQRLQLLTTDGLKMHGTGYSGSYTIGYNAAMHDVQQFVRKEWKNLT